MCEIKYIRKMFRRNWNVIMDMIRIFAGRIYEEEKKKKKELREKRKKNTLDCNPKLN